MKTNGNYKPLGGGAEIDSRRMTSDFYVEEVKRNV